MDPPPPPPNTHSCALTDTATHTPLTCVFLHHHLNCTLEICQRGNMAMTIHPHTLTFPSTASLPFVAAVLVAVVVVVEEVLSSPQSHSGMLGSGEPGILVTFCCKTNKWEKKTVTKRVWTSSQTDPNFQCRNSPSGQLQILMSKQNTQENHPLGGLWNMFKATESYEWIVFSNSDHVRQFSNWYGFYKVVKVVCGNWSDNHCNQSDTYPS